MKHLILPMTLCFAIGIAVPANAATLPVHDPLRIIIVSDAVNPHGLPPSSLTEPGELLAAITNPASGINVDAAQEVPTDLLSTVTPLLLTPFGDPSAYDVLIYFSHRIPAGLTGAQDQVDFVAAVDSFLAMGGGVISFHHGAYVTAGKEAMQDIIGCTATGAVLWDTTNGQNVINVAPGHFVTTNEVEYPASTSYGDAGNGIPADIYDYFNNLPDEHYPNFSINPSAGDIEILFASDYTSTHVLGLIHRRPEWQGMVLMYQPGEYQPNAVDSLDGNNFQILANMIYFATHDVATGVKPVTPPRFLLAQNLPNPFNPTTTIHYDIHTPGRVTLTVYGARGELVRELVDGDRSPGPHDVIWNGRDDDGAPVASGVYFYRLTLDGVSQTRKMVLLK